MTDTTDKAERSRLRMTGEWVRQHAPAPVADHTDVLVSLIESGDRKDAATIRMMAGLVLAVLVLVAVVLTLTLGGSFDLQANTEGVRVGTSQERP